MLLGALGPAGRPPPETAGYPGPAGCMAMHWRAPGIRRSQMRRRYEGAHRPVQRPPWVIRRASCGVAVQPWCDAGPDRDRAPGPGRARAAAALRASASNGPREGPSVYCTSALRNALARGSKGVHVPQAQRRRPGVCEGAAHPRLAKVVHQLTQGGVCWRRPPWLVGCCTRRRRILLVLNPSIILGSKHPRFPGEYNTEYNTENNRFSRYRV